MAAKETGTSVLSQAPARSVLLHPARIASTNLLCFTYEADLWRVQMRACTSHTHAVSNFLYFFDSLVCWADFSTDCLIDGYSKGIFMSPINNPLKVFLFFLRWKMPLDHLSKRWSLSHLSWLLFEQRLLGACLALSCGFGAAWHAAWGVWLCWPRRALFSAWFSKA